MPMSENNAVAKSFSLAVSVEREGDGDQCNSKDERVIDLLETIEPPKIGGVGIRGSTPKKVLG